MNWTPDQSAVIAHPPTHHALVRAAPGAGKTTTLVGRVQHLLATGTDPARIRVVMFNKSIQQTFVQRLGQDPSQPRVRVSTFDALGYEVLRVAGARGLLSKPLDLDLESMTWLAGDVYAKGFRDTLVDADEIRKAIAFWKGHLVAPSRAAFPTNPALVEAYREYERRRQSSPSLSIGFDDMVYTAVSVLKKHPGLLGDVDHLLVDEFQDVNPARTALLHHLSQPATSLLVVGDEDQGINEWCGAHPRYFRDFEATFPSLPTVSYRLARTHRFGPGIAEPASRLVARNRERAPGAIEGGGKEGRIGFTSDVVGHVRKLMSSGVAPRDIAILYRGRAQAAGILSALAGAKIPVHTADASVLQGGRGPALLKAYLQAMTGDTQVDAWSVMFAPGLYVKRAPFLAHLAARGGDLLATLGDRWGAVRHGQEIYTARNMEARGALLARAGKEAFAGRALDVLVRSVDIGKQLASRWRESEDVERTVKDAKPAEADLALAAFVGLHAALRNVPTREAVAWLGRLQLGQGAEIGSCVHAGTIHAAKGLEWKHVILPDVTEGRCPNLQDGQVAGTLESPDGVPQSPWIEQERRIFYVGVTRAVETCTIEVGDGKRKPSRFVDELVGGAVAGWSPPVGRGAARAWIAGLDAGER